MPRRWSSGVPAGIVHSVCKPLRGSAGLGVHLRGGGLVGGGDDVDTGLCALFLRGHDERPEARWLQRLKAWQNAAVHRVGRTSRWSLRSCWSWSSRRLRYCPSSADLHADFKEAISFCRYRVPSRDLRSNRCWTPANASAPMSWPCPMCKASSSKSPRGVGRGYIRSASNRISRRAQADATVDQGARNKNAGHFGEVPGIQSEVVTFLAIASAKA